jgi:hypothetical protein
MTVTAAPRPANPLAALPPEIARIVEVAEGLILLLDHETTLVRTMRIGEIAPLQAEKVRLTALYQGLLKGLGGPANEKVALPPPQKAVLVDVGKRLADAAVANQRALKVGQVATDRLIGSIVTAIKQQRPSTAGYNTRKVAPRSVANRIAGVTVDCRL